MGLIFKISLILFIHLGFFVCYPDAGPMRNVYLWVSFVLWSGGAVFLSTSLNFMRGFISVTVHLLFFGLALAIISYTMPQADEIPVIRKIQRGRYPTRDDIYHGLLRFGIRIEKIAQKEIDGLDGDIKRALKKLKE